MLNYLIAALVAIVIALSITSYMLKKEVDKLNQDMGIYKTQVKELGNTIKNKDQDIALCNSRVDELVNQGEERSVKAETAKKEAQKSAQENLKLADELLRLKRETGKSACDSANNIVNDYINTRKDRGKNSNTIH